MAPPERDEDDAGRLALAQAELRRRTIQALREVIGPRHRDAHSLRRLFGCDLERIGGEDLAAFEALAWRWRRQLPRGLAPVLPPHDPIVRAMEGSRA